MEITGIVHAHSTYSYDAKLTLRELRDLCLSRGVRFVCMTEHTDEMTSEGAEAFVKECESLSDDTFRFIPGFEVPYQVDRETKNHAHVLMIGCRTFHVPYAPDTETLRSWVRSASLVVLAHPVRNHFVVNPELLELMHGVEVWNQQYEGKRVPRTRSLKLFAELKEKKETLIATGGVDFHRTEHMGAPFIHMDIESLTEEHILEKLHTGAFTVASDRALMYGSLPSAEELIQKHRIESVLSVTTIVLGKFVNKTLKSLGLSLPKSLKERIRASL